jgi:hypothetical protein
MANNELTQDINNVYGFERFLSIVANDIREGKFNIKFIKKISETAKTFFEDFTEDDVKELKEKHLAEVEAISNSMLETPGVSPNVKHHFSPHTFEVSDDEEESDGEIEFLPTHKEASAFSFDDEEIDKKMKELEALLKKPGPTPQPKKEDKVICDFLNNTIDTSKYHYLKSMTTSKLDIDSYCTDCYSY